MKRITQILPLILAAALQLMPLLRNIVTSPAATSSFAIILRWTIGSAATLGVVDAVSGATSVYTSPSTFSGSVGTSLSNNVVCAIGGGNNASKSDYFIVSYGGVTSPTLTNKATTTLTLPPGLTFMASWVNGATTIGGIIYGTPTTAGTYPTTVTVVSPGNATLSQNITITITGAGPPTAPTITAQPSGTNVLAGKSATFSVVASGTAPLGYYWLKNGVNLTNGGNVSGANTATLTLTNIAATDAANYSVLVSNSVGSVTSSNAALAINSPPTISTQPVSQILVAGSTSQFTVTAGGSAPLAYQWLKNGAVVANGGNVSGATTATLSLATLSSADAAIYSAVVTNSSGSITSSVAALTVLLPPAIVTQPVSASVSAGTNVSFTVIASGTAPLSYQWLKNGVTLANGGNVSGATTATLSLTGISAGDTANYSVTITNSVGSVTSGNAALTLLSTAIAITSQPASATVPQGSPTTLSVTASSTSALSYQWLKNGVNISGANLNALTFSTVSTNDAGNYSVVITNSANSITSAMATLTVLLPPVILTQPASATVPAGSNVTFFVTANGTAPLAYQWLKNGSVISGATAAMFSLSNVSTTDTANYSVAVTNSVGSITSSIASLTVLTPPSIVTQPASLSVAPGSNVTFSVTASGTAPLACQWLKNGGVISGATVATLNLANVSLADAASYSVVVTNSVGKVTSGSAVLTVVTPLVIVTQPAGQIAPLGIPAAFNVVASGAGTLSFQWFKGGLALADGGTISGSTTSNLNITMVAAGDAGVYCVVVTNLNGSITSSNAALAIPPSSGSFSATVGTFFNNNVVIPLSTGNTADVNDYFILAAGAVTSPLLSNGQSTTSTLPPGLTFVASWVNGASALTGVIYGTPTASGSYPITVSVVSPGNPVISQNLTLIIGNATGSSGQSSTNPPVAAITNQPVGVTAVAGGNASFNVLAGGTAPMGYQWFFNTNTSLPNATSSTLSLTNIRASQAGNYSVVISNTAGAITSSPAMLAVTLPSPPTIQSPAVVSGKFQFSFNPVVGLTNSVMTNNNVSGGTWGVLTNVPPPTTANSITISDTISGTNRFYRVKIMP
jgi:plastocyanin